MGKGSARRPGEGYEENFERIFGGKKMEQESDIVRMAREAGAKMLHGGEFALFGDAAIANFSALVAAAEREECAKVCEEIAKGYSVFDSPTNAGMKDQRAYFSVMCLKGILARGNE